ncbi:putative helicase mov-10-B.1 [Manduca sexta]|uniref:putative helicase mov-10-B.1 n=1 Tax=Manduca sexta TaxID=7130 RepID=UPI00188E863A|nr:putative helicase mov-10-B.1 [Manduca sexta]
MDEETFAAALGTQFSIQPMKVREHFLACHTSLLQISPTFLQAHAVSMLGDSSIPLAGVPTKPESVAPFSNGTNRDDFEEVTIQEFMSYNITITTLAHSSVYATRLKAEKYERYITHLFIDEAAQGNEPQCLIPICGLLSSKGSLILAGDPLQLGPVIISHSARSYGLGVSLMERLQKTFPMYHPEDGDPNYTVMLRNNFRSNPDILRIPNALFYNEQLNAKAAIDPISNTDILHEGHPSRAIAFHGILSREEKSSASTR